MFAIDQISAPQRQRFTVHRFLLAFAVVLALLLNAQPAAASPPSTGYPMETCSRSRTSQTATTVEQCSRWSPSGPVNVVIFAPKNVDVFKTVTRSTGWRPAHGHWLVARAAISQGELGCKPGWSASREQIERRITAVRRYHLKLVHPACAAAGEQVLMADAHQDFYDTRRCHGDYSKGTDVPRDEFIADLRKAGLVERVSLKEAYDPAARYPNGCGGVVQSDGRVAFVWLRAKAPGGTPH